MNKDDDVERVAMSLQMFLAYMKNIAGCKHMHYINASTLSTQYNIGLKEATATIERIKESCVDERSKLLAILKKGEKYLQAVIEDLELTVKVSAHDEQE